MREILFRGKRKDNGQWVEGWLVKCCTNTYPKGYEIIDIKGINYDELDYFHPSYISYEVDPTTISLYTGLTDIGGRKIFEGDIMKTAVTGITHHTGVVEFADGSFGLRCTDGAAYFLCFVAASYTIIGNIHDNPELVEVQE